MVEGVPSHTRYVHQDLMRRLYFAKGDPSRFTTFGSTISLDGTTACECPPSVVIYSSDSSDEAASSKAKVLEMGGANLNSSAVDANPRSDLDMFQTAV